METLTDLSEVVRQHQEIMELRKSLHLEEGYHGLFGKSGPMQTVYELIDHVGKTDAPVMIHGGSGTGKELVARAIHDVSPRRDNPFIKVNCAALNENLLESELFGHIRGAYTGADRNRIGRFEAAHEGTIFLDEVGDIPLSIQVKLLRVLEEKEIERVGDHRPIKVDVRIVSATNRNLKRLIESGQFREDLFFRINVFPIKLPLLRERAEDIPFIVQHFMRLNNARTGKRILGLSPEAMEKLLAYPWPGNVRELRNAIEYAYVLCPDGGIGTSHLPPQILSDASQDFIAPSGEKERLISTLESTNWNQTEAARRLGVSRVTIWKRIKKHRLKKPEMLGGKKEKGSRLETAGISG